MVYVNKLFGMERDLRFSDYEERTQSTVKYVGDLERILSYLGLGLVGEGGEVAEKIKKFLRDEMEMSDSYRDGMLRELGDVLWYLTRMSVELGSSLEEVAEKNLEKLSSRRERGVISGSGDNR